MMTKEGSTKIVNFLTPGAGVLVLGHGHTSYYREYALSSTLSMLNIEFCNILRDYDVILHPFAIIEFYSFYDGAVDMQT